METKLLIKQAKKGNKEALVQLIMAQKSEYYRLAYAFMKNKEDALDAMQDMILLLYESIGSVKKEESFYSWSKTILVNTCKKKLRQRKRIIPIEEVNEQSIDTTIHSQQKIELERYIKQLSSKHQEVIRLRYYLDMDYETISLLLKIPLGTVKSRLNTGMKNLRQLLGGEYLND